MRIILNGFPEYIDEPSITIQELLERLEEDDPAVIAELNGRYTPRKIFKDTPIKDGDTVEFIHPSFGG